MSFRVYKYPLELVDGIQDVALPAEAKVLHFAMQGRKPTLWALIEPDDKLVPRGFIIHGTGHPVAAGLVHCGTTLAPDGFVWHLFERRK